MNVPVTTMDWQVQFGDIFEDITFANDCATVGLNSSLYLLDPQLSQDGSLFSCHVRNIVLISFSTGYVRVHVQGKNVIENSVT